MGKIKAPEFPAGLYFEKFKMIIMI